MKRFIVMVILKPDIQEIDFVQSDIVSIIENNGKVKKIWMLGKEKINYKVKKYTEGIHLKVEVMARKHKIDKIKEELRRNRNVIFSIVMNDEKETKDISILKKCIAPFNRLSKVSNSDRNEYKNKVYMLISKDINLPFSEPEILNISENKNRLFENANKKIKEYIFVKNYHTLSKFKSVKDIEIELRKNGKVEFLTQDNTCIKKQLLIREKCLI